jgi:hypothetical protein
VARRRRPAPLAGEDKLTSDDPAVWVTPAEVDGVRLMVARGAAADLEALWRAGASTARVWPILYGRADDVATLPLIGRALDDELAACLAGIVEQRRRVALAEWMREREIGPDERPALCERFGIESC